MKILIVVTISTVAIVRFLPKEGLDDASPYPHRRLGPSYAM